MVECANAIYDGTRFRSWCSRGDIFIGVRDRISIATECPSNTRDRKRSAVQDVPHEFKTEQVRRKEMTFSKSAVVIGFKLVRWLWPGF